MPAKALIVILFLCFPGLAHTQGYAGLGTQADGFATPTRGTSIAFPRDHGPHPNYRIEWWYLTATLTGDDGKDYGIQWTLFRSALAPEENAGWTSPQIWMGHAGLTTPSQHFFAERLARGGIGQAGVRADPFEAWIDDWHMTGDPGSELNLFARGGTFSYDLNLSTDAPFVLHGDQGYSVKSEAGQASFYYSQPAYRVTGTLNLPGGLVHVTGNGWLDREWSSQPLAEDQSGWDWFSLSFDDGSRLMGFVLRGEQGDFTSGTWIGPDNISFALAPGTFLATPLGTTRVNGRRIPTEWHVQYPDKDIDVTVAALNPDAWMGTNFAYWEGPVSISGSHTGRGYLEMTGY